MNTIDHSIFQSKMATILCCVCGTEIEQNPANMCMTCIRENYDITENINKQLIIHSCRSCGRFHLYSHF
jgi:nonsense-mediated mRNA decay protein 3